MRPQGDIPIGEVSRRTGCNIETVRYYERIGLLPAPHRSGGRYRMYGAAEVGRLAFVRRARELGFTLDEVRALLALAAGGDGACSEVRGLAAAHLADVRKRFADLRAMERALADAVRRYDACEAPECPLIGALSSGAAPVWVRGPERLPSVGTGDIASAGVAPGASPRMDAPPPPRAPRGAVHLDRARPGGGQARRGRRGTVALVLRSYALLAGRTARRRAPRTASVTTP